MILLSKNDGYQLSARNDLEPKTARSTVAVDAPFEQLQILSGRWDGTVGQQSLRITRASGKRTELVSGPAKSPPVDLFGYMLGNANLPDAASNSRTPSFSGLIGALLIYSRSLGDDELGTVEDHLHQYYFQHP